MITPVACSRINWHMQSKGVNVTIDKRLEPSFPLLLPFLQTKLPQYMLRSNCA